MDGGKGQLSMAVSALRELGLDYLPIISLAKKLEEVFIPGNSDAQSIHKQSPGLILLRQLRDEAHRFAIEFQRQKRSKSISDSVFLSIKGMGKKKVQKLLSKGCQEQLLRKNAPSKIFYIITHGESMAYFLHFAISLYIGGRRIFGLIFWEACYVGVRRFLQEPFYIRSLRETAKCNF